MALAQSYDEASEAYDNGNYADAFTLASDLGEADIKRDVDKAITWYTKAAEQDDKNAQYNLAYMCDIGHVGLHNCAATSLNTKFTLPSEHKLVNLFIV